MIDWNNYKYESNYDIFSHRRFKLLFELSTKEIENQISAEIEDVLTKSHNEMSVDKIDKFWEFILKKLIAATSLELIDEVCSNFMLVLKPKLENEKNPKQKEYLQCHKVVFNDVIEKLEGLFRYANDRITNESEAKFPNLYSRFILFKQNEIYYVNSSRTLYDWYANQIKGITKDFKSYFVEVALYDLECGKDLLDDFISNDSTYPLIKSHYKECKRRLTVAQHLIGSQFTNLIPNESDVEYEKLGKSFKWLGTPEQLNSLYEMLGTEYNDGVIESRVSFLQFKQVFNYQDLGEIEKKKINWISSRGNQESKIFDLRFLIEELMIRGLLAPSQSKLILKIITCCFKYDGEEITKTPKRNPCEELKTLLDKIFKY